MAIHRVGFCLSDKKRKRMNLEAFADLCRRRGIEVVEIDLNQPMASQGPFDVIVHKLSDVIVEAEHDSQSQRLLTNFQFPEMLSTEVRENPETFFVLPIVTNTSDTTEYVSLHPDTILLDPLPAMTQLLDRFVSYRIMNTLQNSMREVHVCTPPYLEISTGDQLAIRHEVERKQLTYPLICKTRVAHGSRSHEMSLIFSAEGLKDAHPPCVLQSFVNHGAVLHKVFVVGEDHFIVERPSLKNFPPGPCDRKTIFFNSHEVSKPESSSHLTALDEKSPRMPLPSGDVMMALVRQLRAKLGMALFGVDVIVDMHTCTLTIIDINIFPGYEGVPQFFSSLLSHIESVLETRKKPHPLENSPVPTPISSH